MNDKVVMLPMSSKKCNMQNKKCDYKTLAIMTLYSNFTPIEMQDEKGVYETYRFLYKNKIIKFTKEIEEISNNKINTIIKNMRKLSNLDGDLVIANVNEAGEIYYIINYADEKERKYVTIEDDILRMLINACSSHAIKIYILLKYICGDKEKKMTREFIAKQIGLSSSKGVDIVSDCTSVLASSGFINKRKEYNYGNDVKCDVYYSVNSHDKWLEIKNRN